MKIGIIGHGADKFTEESENHARQIIRQILHTDCDTVVSGHSPVGGIDIWAEEEANNLSIPLEIKTPRQHRWDAEYGYKQRNLDIARTSDVVYVIVVKDYPPDYHGMRFNRCYHCNKTDHIKSGACWTAKEAKKMGKEAYWIII